MENWDSSDKDGSNDGDSHQKWSALDLNDLNEFKCDWTINKGDWPTNKKVIDQQTIENGDSPTNMWFNHG